MNTKGVTKRKWCTTGNGFGYTPIGGGGRKHGNDTSGFIREGMS